MSFTQTATIELDELEMEKAPDKAGAFSISTRNFNQETTLAATHLE
jgi:hypothetical protein